MKRHLPDIIFLACLLLAFGVYFPGTSGYFVFDDSLNIVENTHIQIQSLDFLTLKQTAVSGGAGIFGRPLSVISFAFNYYLTGLNPFYFKLTNIVIHLLNGSCVYLLTYLLLGTQRRRDMATPNRNNALWHGVCSIQGTHCLRAG